MLFRSARRKAAGNSQRLAKTGACRGFASKPAPFFNARRCSFLFPHFSQCGDCCALRATMILISFYSVLAGLRPAGSHCENSGSSDGSGASARSDRAQTAQILRDRSASAGGGTRYYSPCLIFWCFWIKTKARKKESKRIFFRSILRETILPLRLCVSCKERIYHLLSPKGGAKSVRREPPSDLIPPPVQCGDSCALCAMIIIRLRPHMAGLRPAGSHCESSG